MIFDIKGCKREKIDKINNNSFSRDSYSIRYRVNIY